MTDDELTAPLFISRSEFNALDHALQITVLDVALQKLHTELVFPEKTYNDWFRQLRENVSQSILYSSEKWIIHIAI